MGALVLGLALLSKVTAYVAIALLVVAELGSRWLGTRPLQRHAAILTAITGGSLLISGWWFIRNAAVYGELDVLGLRRHGEVVIGQPHTVWSLEALRHFGVTTFQSFWATFGWMGVLIDSRIYGLLALLTAIAAIGLAVFVAQRFRALCPWQQWGMVILALELSLMVGVLVFYNVTYLQPQGRYLFPASAAIGVFLALGLREMIDRPRTLALALAAGGVVLFIAGGGKLVVLAGGLLALLILLAWTVRARYRSIVWAGLVALLVLLDITVYGGT